MRLHLLAALIVSLASTAALAAPTTCTPSAPQAACIAISEAVETFRTAIIKKDRASFLALFFSESIPWIGVTTDNSLQRESAESKAANRPAPNKVYASSNPLKFIDNIVKDKDLVEEKFDNVRIDTDGDIAQVLFDYSFNYAGYKANWGKESWHMVRTASGWKINSVIWTMEFNPVPPPK